MIRYPSGSGHKTRLRAEASRSRARRNLLRAQRATVSPHGFVLGGVRLVAYLISALKSILEACSLVAGASGSTVVAVLPSIRPLNFALSTKAWSSGATSVNPAR